MNQLILFDCDGVLVDTEPLAHQVLVNALQSAGVAQPQKLAEASVGRSLADVRLMITRQEPATDSDQFWTQLITDTEQAVLTCITPDPIILEVIEQLSYPFCVASSGTHQKIRTSLSCAGLLEHFEGKIFSAEDVKRGKPAPDLFLHAAKTMGVPPEACCVIEDSKPGLSAAIAAGMHSLHYAPGGASNHAYHARGFGEIPHLVATIFAMHS